MSPDPLHAALREIVMPSRLAIPPGAQHEDPVDHYRERAAYSRTRAT